MANTEPFWNREEQFKAWLTQHSEDGYLLNCIKTGTRPGDYVAIMLHRASCPAFNGNNPRTGKNFTNKGFCKVCALRSESLQDHAVKKGGKRVPRCQLCL
jgi:hypothetical protein